MENVKTLSARGITFLKDREGFRFETYLDSAGHETIGFGHKLLPGEEFPNGITIEEAEELLAKDTGWAQDTVNENVTHPINQNQFDMLVSLVYNIGADAFKESTLLRVLNEGDIAEAAEQILRWKYAGGKPILLGRRKLEREIFLA